MRWIIYIITTIFRWIVRILMTPFAFINRKSHEAFFSPIPMTLLTIISLNIALYKSIFEVLPESNSLIKAAIMFMVMWVLMTYISCIIMKLILLIIASITYLPATLYENVCEGLKTGRENFRSSGWTTRESVLRKLAEKLSEFMESLKNRRMYRLWKKTGDNIYASMADMSYVMKRECKKQYTPYVRYVDD